jgi:DedD protein
MADNDAALDLRRRARRRLIGAIALVLALVIVPPWIMDLDPRPVTTDLKVEIPPQDANRLKPPAAVTRPPEAAPAPAKREGPPVAEAKPAPSAPDKPKAEAARSVAKTDAATVARAAPGAKGADAKRAEAILNAEGFVVQLGVFADKENAKKLEARLAKAGVQHYSESVPAGGGEQTRVRAGPYPSRESAEQAREQLKGMGLAPGPVIARQ